MKCNTDSSAITEKLHCRVGQLLQKGEDWNWESIFYRHYRSIFNQCDLTASKAIEFREKTQNKSYYAVQGHQDRYQSRACMRLPISY